MTTKQQFDILWKAAFKEAVFALVTNKGKPLSRVQLKELLGTALNNCLVGQVITISRLANVKPNQIQVRRLVSRCLELDWIGDAMSAACLGSISVASHKRLVRAAIKKGYGETEQEIETLLKSD